MAATQFSIGRDCQLVVIGPQGRVDLSYVTAFQSNQVTQPVRVDRLDGIQMATELPKGWEGSFEVERGSSAVDDFIAAAEVAYRTSGSLPYGQVYQYVNEPDGSTSTYQYTGVVFRLVNAGIWRGDGAVKQKLEFFAAARVRL
jgi:hypothetical protein